MGEFAKSYFHVPSENIRRIIHFLTGIYVVLSPYFFDRPFWIYILALAFSLGNLVAIQQNWFKSMHDIARKSYGTALFPLALAAALLLTHSHDLLASRAYMFQVGFLILAIADPLASWVGTSIHNPTRFKILHTTKSVQGTAAFFIAAFLSAFMGLHLWTSGGSFYILQVALLLAIITTLTELLGGKGWDNFFIVISSITLLNALHVEDPPLTFLWIATVVGCGFAYLSYNLQFLNLSGALATALLATSVLGLGGWKWAIPALTFFVLSSLLSKWGKKEKQIIEIGYEKGSNRDAGQVFANGGIPWCFLILYGFFPSEVWYWGFCGAFAATCADTWATEIGGYFKQSTFSIRTGKLVQAGTNGGVSLVGTLGAILGALVIALLANLFHAPFMPILIAGFAAALLDSFLGATVQGIYQDSNGNETEKPSTHSPLIRGYQWINNDKVNFIANLFGGFIAIILSQ